MTEEKSAGLTHGVPIEPPGVDDPKTEGRLVHLLWYVGTATTLASLTVFAHTIARDHPMRLAWVLLAYASAGIAVALFFMSRERARNVLTGLLVTASILALTGAWLLAQDSHGRLNYKPFPTDYHRCGGAFPGKCELYPPYDSLGPLARLTHSPLGAVVAATAASVLALALFRFIPMIVITIFGLWYLIFELMAPFDDRSSLKCTLVCGLVSLLLGWILDLRLKNNYGFWVNKIGTWGTAFGLAYFFKDQPEGLRFLFFVLNVFGTLLALYLRRSSGVLGFLIGAFTYLYYEYLEHFQDTLVFPVVLLALGALMIWTGWRLHRAAKDLEILLPPLLQRVRPFERIEPVFFGAEGILERLR